MTVLQNILSAIFYILTFFVNFRQAVLRRGFVRLPRGTFLLPLLVLLTAGAPATAQTAGKNTIIAVRIGDHDTHTRFVLEMTGNPEYRIFVLPDPYRVVVDFSESDWRIPNGGAKRKTGLVQNYRYGLFRPGTSRLVLDVARPVKIVRSVILPKDQKLPYRFFIDIKPVDRKAFLTEVANSRARFTRNAKPEEKIALISRSRNKVQKWKIVLDAGHGGVDPGALGRSGVYEKKLTLQVTKKLGRKLEATGRYKVSYTRFSDRFLSLKQRVNFARKAKADLFISIHADSIGRADIRGSTVYTLSEKASDKEAAALARKENKSDIIAGVDLEAQDNTVQSILIDLAQRETKNFSVKFAELLMPEIIKAGMKTGSRSHRFAGFRVLKAPDVPSVLVEMGYLSNRADERMLTSAAGQNKLSDAIVKAIDKYFKDLEA